MTSREWWWIGSRLLGIYFVATGAVYATNAIMYLGLDGIDVPDGSPRWVFVLGPLLQGTIFATAGYWLIQRSATAPEIAPVGAEARQLTFLHALQLLGVYFLVGGVSELAGAAVDSYFTHSGWLMRASQIGSGGFQTSAGWFLVAAPSRVADKLATFAR